MVAILLPRVIRSLLPGLVQSIAQIVGVGHVGFVEARFDDVNADVEIAQLSSECEDTKLTLLETFYLKYFVIFVQPERIRESLHAALGDAVRSETSDHTTSHATGCVYNPTFGLFQKRKERHSDVNHSQKVHIEYLGVVKRTVSSI